MGFNDVVSIFRTFSFLLTSLIIITLTEIRSLQKNSRPGHIKPVEYLQAFLVIGTLPRFGNRKISPSTLLLSFLIIMWIA
jgi:hypothetical protein